MSKHLGIFIGFLAAMAAAHAVIAWDLPSLASTILHASPAARLASWWLTPEPPSTPPTLRTSEVIGSGIEDVVHVGTADPCTGAPGPCVHGTRTAAVPTVRPAPCPPSSTCVDITGIEFGDGSVPLTQPGAVIINDNMVIEGDLMVKGKIKELPR